MIVFLFFFRTPLHLAAALGSEEMCRFLLANKAKTNLCDGYGRTPLMKVQYLADLAADSHLFL